MSRNGTFKPRTVGISVFLLFLGVTIGYFSGLQTARWSETVHLQEADTARNPASRRFEIIEEADLTSRRRGPLVLTEIRMHGTDERCFVAMAPGTGSGPSISCIK